MEQYELTLSQRSINELQSFYSDTSISVICGAVIFEEKLDADVLAAAAERLIEKHDALRMRFVTEKGRTVQYAESGYAKPERMNFASRQEMREYCGGQAHTAFKNDGSQMFRMTVFTIPDGTGIMLCASHLISDAWTYSILAADVYNICRSMMNGEADVSDSRSYIDYIQKDRQYVLSEKYEADRAYWRKKYSGAIEQTPVRACRRCNTGISAKRFSAVLSDGLCSRTAEFCGENNISSAVLFEAAAIIYLAKLNSGNKSVTVGIPVLGRSSSADKKTAGMFISTIPLTIEVNKNESVLSVMRNISETKREIFRRRRIPYSEILRDIRAEKGFTGRLFDVMVSCQNARTNIKASTEWFSNGYSELPISIHFDDRDGCGRYTVNIDYQTDIFPDEAEIGLIFDRIVYIITQMIGNRDTAVSDISVIPENERKMLLHTFNDTSVPLPDKCVHEAFSEISEKYPDRTALVFHGEKYSCRQLDEMSDALVHYLIDSGIKRNDIVPIISKRSPYVIIAMLAVLKAGGAYMPVSPKYPHERIRTMLENVSAKIALVCGYECGFVPSAELESFDYSYTSEACYESSCSDDMCYVIFTSGSTGKPKAAAVTHRNVMNYCAENRFNVVGNIISDKERGIVSVTDIVFDIFVTESILPLLNGITVYLADDEQALSQKGLAGLVCDSMADIIQTTPTKMRSFMLDKKELGYLSGFRKIILGGEELTPDFCRELKKYTSADIYNIYGPAETTVWASAAPADENDIVIGKPLANTRIYIMDNGSELLPIGTAGEICISGECVGKGYFNEPLLTSEKFVPDPFVHGKTMYRTGDMGLVRADGNIEFFGRRDSQIKLRGLRIELGEIESVFGSFEPIQHSAVVCRTDANGEKYLAGFYTSEKAVDEKLLRAYISRRLPSYMVPRVFVRLAEMPLTASGKTDRKALQSIGINFAENAENYTAPSSEREEILCGLAAKVLGIKRVGIEDDFFELGGDSFSAMEFTALADSCGIVFSLKKVYECRTVKALCASLSEERSRKSRQLNALMKYPQRRTAEDLMIFSAFEKLTNAVYSFGVTGLDGLDLNNGRYIFCPNHESDLDCMWVMAALSRAVNINEICALIAAEHLDDPLHKMFFRISGGIPIERKGEFMPSLNRAVNVIRKRKRFMIIHPEGTRTRDGRLGQFKKGAALVSVKSGVKIVPVYIEGAGEIYPVCRRLPHLFDIRKAERYPLHISFGTPISPEGKTAEGLTEELRSAIISLGGSEAHGNRYRR